MEVIRYCPSIIAMAARTCRVGSAESFAKRMFKPCLGLRIHTWHKKELSSTACCRICTSFSEAKQCRKSQVFDRQRRYFSSERVIVKKINLMGPLRWLDVKAKMFLLTAFFDKDFDQEDFLEGAKQAVCLVSSYISDENYKELSELLSEQAIKDYHQILMEESDKARIKVKESDIEMLRINNMGFIYGENGKKFVDILVTCFCKADDETLSKKFGNVNVVISPHYRIFNFAFLREYTPGITSNWIVNRIEFVKKC